MGLKIFHMTISRYLDIFDYKKFLSKAIPILTTIYKQKHIE